MSLERIIIRPLDGEYLTGWMIFFLFKWTTNPPPMIG